MRTDLGGATRVAAGVNVADLFVSVAATTVSCLQYILELLPISPHSSIYYLRELFVVVAATTWSAPK